MKLFQSRDDLIESYDKLAENYEKETDTFHHQISHYVLINNLITHLQKGKDFKILDSGGGIGTFATKLSQLGYDITLSDISSKSLNIARKRFAELKQNIPTIECDSENTPFPDESFDMVMYNGGVISYTPSPEGLIKETARILKKGGFIWFDALNPIGWAIESPEPETKAKLALEKEKLIKMEDWDYPARLISLDQTKPILSKYNFSVKATYGLIVLSHSLPLDFRYSNLYDIELVKKYQKVEFELSRRQDCVGSAWSYIVCAELGDNT